jgi:IS1 family transposase
LFGLKMSDEKFFTIVQCLGEGNGTRETGRINNVKPDTVSSVIKRMGTHVMRILEHHLMGLCPTEIQLDELWSFLRKKEGHLTVLESLEKEWGDCWVWIAFDPVSKVILGIVLGKRTKGRAIQLLKRVRQIIGKQCFPLFTSDELAAYEDALIEVFGITVQVERKGTRGRIPLPKQVPHPRLKYATVHKERNDNRVVKVTRKMIMGNERKVKKILKESTVSTKVNTSFIERENGKLRADNGRLVRKTLGFSKIKELFRASLGITIAYDHYCRPHKGLRQRIKNPCGNKHWNKRSPMMALGKTDHIWSIEELTLFRIPNICSVHPFIGLQ